MFNKQRFTNTNKKSKINQKVVAIFRTLGIKERLTTEHKGIKKSLGYNWFRAGSAIDYIARTDAILVQPRNYDNDKLNNLFLRSGKSEEDFFRSFLKEYSNDSSLTGLYEFTKNANDVNLEVAKNNLRRLSNEQRIFSLIFSPSSQMIFENRLFSKNDWVEILREEILLLCKKNNIDTTKVKGYLGIHANTNTPHAHLIFFETAKSYQTKDSKEKIWFNKRNFTWKSIEEFKINIQRRIDTKFYKQYESKLLRSKNSLYQFKREFNENVLKLSNSFSDLSIQKKISLIASYCLANKAKTYKKIKDKKIKEYIEDVSEYLKKESLDYRELTYKYDKFLKTIKDIEAYDNLAVKELNNLYNREIEERNSKVYSFLIKTCLKLDRKYKVEKNNADRYLSNFYSQNKLSWSNEIDKVRINDLYKLLEHRKILLAEELNITFNSEVNQFIKANEINENKMKDFKRNYALLKSKISNNKYSLDEITNLKETEFVIDYLTKHNNDFNIFNANYEEMLNEFSENIQKVTNEKVKYKAYEQREKFEKDIKKAKVLVVLSQMNFETKGSNYRKIYNLNSLWKEKAKQARAIQEFYSRFGIDVEEMINYVFENH